MKGLWKENISGWHKDSRRKKTTRKHSIRDNSKYILRDSYKDINNITHYENAQTITYYGSRWGSLFTLPEFSNIKMLDILIPFKGDEYNEEKSVFRTIKAYHKGSAVNGEWIENETDKPVKEFLGLNILQKINLKVMYISEENYGKKLLDWTEERERRAKNIIVRDFITTQNEFVYNKPLPKWFKWTMYYESSSRKFAHKYVTGQTRASVRNWIQKGDWDSERKIPWGEISYAWIVD